MFPNVIIMVLLLLVGVFLQKHYKCGFQPILGIVFGFLGAKSWVNKWATVGSISGPQLGSYL